MDQHPGPAQCRHKHATFFPAPQISWELITRARAARTYVRIRGLIPQIHMTTSSSLVCGILLSEHTELVAVWARDDVVFHRIAHFRSFLQSILKEDARSLEPTVHISSPSPHVGVRVINSLGHAGCAFCDIAPFHEITVCLFSFPQSQP